MGFNLAKQTRFLDVSLPSLTALLHLRFKFYGGHEHDKNFFFSFRELRYSPLESIPESFPTLEKLNEIRKEEWGLEQHVFSFK